MTSTPRQAARSLARSPGVAASAVVTLALGVGANTAIFSAIDEALFRPWPVSQPGRLAQVYSFDRKTGAYVSSSYPDYEAFARHSRSFRRLSAYVRLPLNVTMGERAERVPIEAVTANYFAMLDLAPAAGRAFLPEDDSPGAPPAAMIGEDFAAARYGGPAAAIGKSISIEDRRFAIVGVVPRRFRGVNLNWGDPPRLWIPLGAAPLVIPQFAAIDILHRRLPWLVLIGRLRPGVPAGAAQAEVQAIAADLARFEPATNRDLTAVVYPAARARFWPSYRGQVSRSLTAFAIAAGLVLLLACANVATLLVARALGRRREFAIRLALGASRAHLFRQSLVESLLLAVPGFLCSLAVAAGLARVVLLFPNALGLPLALDLSLEWRALAFCAVLSLVSALLFGLAPLAQAARPGVLEALKSSGNALTPGRSGLRYGLVAAQVALSCILLAAGGVFGRSLLKAWSIDLGFRPANLLVLSFSPPATPVTSAALESLEQTLARELARLPGVKSAAYAADPPLTPIRSRVQVSAPGGAPFAVDRNRIGPGYLQTLGIALAAGREFDAGDHSAKVAIVNESLAARLWPGESAVGRTISIQGAPHQVIGVARDGRYVRPWDPPEPYLFQPVSPQAGATCLLLGTEGRPEAPIPAIRGTWDRLARRLPLVEIQTGTARVNAALAPERLAAAILGAFGLLAAVLASLGIYSVMAYTVVERRREIAIRMALGAGRESIVRLFLGRSLRLTAGGVVAGIAIGAPLMRLIAAQLREVSPYDPLTFAAVAIAVSAVGAAATLVPAARAAATDPNMLK